MSRQPTPADKEIEQCVLACMLLDNNCRDERVRASRFYYELHKHMCRAISVMDARGTAVDPVTVVRTMHRLGFEVRALDVEKIMAAVPNIGHFEWYVSELVSVHKRRRLLDAARWLAKEARDMTSDPDAVWERLKGARWE